MVERTGIEPVTIPDFQSSALHSELPLLYLNGGGEGTRTLNPCRDRALHLPLCYTPSLFFGAPGTSRTCITELRRLLLIHFSYRGKVMAPLERFELPPPRSVVWCSISAELQGYLAGQGGLEPPISGFGVRCISHLCYCPAKKKIGQGARIELT